MGKFTKIIPLWIKEPICIFLCEVGRIPFKIALSHAACDYVDLRNVTGENREQTYRTRQKRVFQYLFKKYGNIINQQDNYWGNWEPDAPVWFFWWQGLTDAPGLVRICFESLRRNSGTHPVVVIDQWNYQHYVQFPEYIIEKLHKGIISITHFSVIMRVNLLASYGGFWCDATVYCTRKIPEDIFSRCFFTCRNPNANYENISDWNWTGYLMAGWKGNAFFCQARDLFNAYWKEENKLIDYFLIDYIYKLIYERNSHVKKMIESIPPNNTAQTFLQEHFRDQVTPEMLQFIEDGDTWLFKTSWKAIYPEVTDGKETLYGYWLRMNREMIK